ncbi:MAG: ribokinase [Xanthomonadales bacterium]|nr:ribokinase [Xanthomonadales bacterium]
MARIFVVGSYNHDLIFRSRALPRPGETQLGRFASAHGGKGFNQAVAAGRLGVSTTFIGAVGKDKYGAAARTFAEEEGIDFQVESAGTSTGLACVITDPGGQNQIVVAPGANLALSDGHTDRCLAGIGDDDICLAQLECNPGTVAHALQTARLASAVTVLNPAPMHPKLSRELLQLADVITPNESEFQYLMETCFQELLPPDWATESVQRVHTWCRQTGISTVVITLGERGCFVSHGNGNAFTGEESFSMLPVVPAEAVDSTGAGDCFNGALCAGICLYGKDFDQAARLANQAAGLSVTRHGAAPSMPYGRELLGEG